MEKFASKVNIKEGLFTGLIASGFIIPLAISFAAVTGQGLFAVVLCCVVCAVFSVIGKSKGGFLMPDIRTIPIVLYIGAYFSSVEILICMLIAGLVFCFLKRRNTNIAISDEVKVALSLGVVLCATVMLTNIYFGIGAYAENAKEMLKAYGNLGFHPNFTGLLPGTITLFTMITYPFKFKTLSKKISPFFVTLAIPFLLNLLLNPNADLTSINESTVLIFGNITYPKSVIPIKIVSIILDSIYLGFYMYVLNNNEACSFGVANAFSFFPLKRTHENRTFNIISAITVIAVTLASTLIFPSILIRIPMHSIGSMLIVFAWQGVPYKLFKPAFAKKGKHIIIFILVAMFFIFDPTLAVMICIVCANDFNKQGEAK